MQDGRALRAQNTNLNARTPEGVAGHLAGGQSADLKTNLAGLGLTERMLGLRRAQLEVEQKIKTAMFEMGQELIKTGNKESARTKELDRQLESLQKQNRELRTAQTRKDPKTLEGDKANAMLARATGQGGAALMAVQATLIANYSVLQGAISVVRSAITTSVELEAAFRNVQAVTTTTGTEMVGLEAKIKAVAASSRFSAVEVAGAALILGQAGMSAKEVGVALDSVVRLASAAGTSLAQAVDLVTSVVGVFDKSVSDTADIANKITQASNSSKISVDKLALGLQYAGNIAAQSGISFEETTAAMAAMSNAGIKSGSTMGTGLRQFLVEVQKPSKEFLEILHQLGLSLSDVDMRSNGLIGVVSKLRAAGFTASEAIKSFDVRGAAAFNALLADPAALERQYQGLLDTKAAVAANEIQMDSLQAQTKRLTTSFGNFASAGLAPLSKLLQGLAGGFATLLQTMSEYPSIATALTTATALFIGLGLTKHFMDIAVGALKLIGIQGTLAAVTGALSTATVGSAWASASAASATTVFGVAAAGATVPTWSLTAAVRGLGAAIAGMSLLTGIGLVITALAGTYAVLTHVLGSTKREIDALKAASNEAKTAVEEKTGAVKSLSDKIADLQIKEKMLTGNTEALKTEAKALNSQFGHMGTQIDLLNPKFSEMIQKLQTTKKEMQDIRRLELLGKAGKDETLLKKQTEEFQKEQSKVANESNLPRQIRGWLKEVGTGEKGGLVQGQREAIEANLRTLENQKATGVEGGLAVEQLKAILGQLKVTEVQAGRRGDFFKRLEGYASTSQAVAATTRTVRENEIGVAEDDARRKFDTQPVFKGKTYSASLPSTYGVQGSIKASTPGISELELFDKTREVLVERIGVRQKMMDTIIAGIKAETIDPGEGERRLVDLRGLNQKSIEEGRAAVTDADGFLKARELQRIAALGKANKGDRSKGGTGETNARRAVETAKIKAEGLAERAFGDSEIAQAKGQVVQAKAQAEADAILATAGRQAGDDRINQAIATHKRQAESLKVMAKGDQISAEAATDLDKIPGLLDAGLAKLALSRTERIKALELEQEKRVSKGDSYAVTDKFKAQEIAAVNAEEDEAIRKYMAAFKDITTKVAKHLDKSGRKMDLLARQEAFEAVKEQGEENVYAAGATGRKYELEVASGDRLAGDTDIKKAKLAQTRVQFDALSQELAALGNETNGWLADTIEIFKRAKAETARLEALLAELRRMDTTGMNATQRGEHDGRIYIAEGALAEAQDRERSAFKDQQKVRGMQQTTRRSMDDTRLSIRGQEESLPQEATWDSLNEKMKQVWENYQNMVRGMDVNKTFGEGMLGTLTGLQGTFSTFFTDLVSGSQKSSNAFRNMAISIIKSMMDVLAQALAMQAVKAILSMFGMPMGGGGGVDYSLSSASSFPSSGLGLKMADGGPIRGGIPGKDSVGVLAMPGEYMLKKSAVDAVGMEYLNGLNSMTNNTVSSSSSSSPLAKPRQPDTTNVWVVAPESKPSMGPKDIVMVITDDMMRGGATRQLVKQIQTGG